MGRRHRKHTHTSCQRKPSSSSSSSSSSEAVDVLNDDDMLTLILLRVPWKKLMQLKCVSRQWLSLITTPYFIHSYSLPPLRASGIFFHESFSYRENNKVYFVHLDHPNYTPSPFRINQYFATCDPICIVQSCNGLLLCCDVLASPEKRDHYVYNPSTNQVDTLPKHSCLNCYALPCITLTFDPFKSLHYKVIAFSYRFQSNVGDFYVYSSETGAWRVSIQSYLPDPDMWFRNGVYWNGCVHWLSQCSESPPVSDSLYFNVAEERLETFPSPPISVWSPASHSYFGESQDHLHYIEVCPYTTSFSVYEMKSDYSEWFVKYQIDLDPIFKVFPEMKRRSFHHAEFYYNVAVISLIRRENFHEDSFLVLEVPGKAIRYNLVDRSFKVIWDFEVDLQVDVPSWICGDFKGWPYITLNEVPNQ